MNYLGHLLLAAHSDAALLGAFLGDFVKGPLPTDLDPDVALEIAVHRRIDAATDAHPDVRAGASLFAPERRRFAGIALDMFHDHVLARDWSRYGDGPLSRFTQRVYAVLNARAGQLPERARYTAQRMAAQDWLGSYVQFAAIAQALNRISQRLSRKGALLADCILDLQQHYTRLADAVPGLIADLGAEAARQRSHLTARR